MKWTFKNNEVSILVGRKEEKKESISYDSEVDILSSFIDSYLLEYKDKLHIVSNSSNYTTLQYEDRDLLRLKYTDTTKWLTIFIHPSFKKDYIDSELFTSQTNKNQLQWKSILSNKNDLSKFVDICIRDIELFQ
jgi:hypothetical protein